jgi:D-threo-aldose 1-dehydrogenase
MGTAWLGRTSDSDDEAVDAVRTAMDLGINYFDTDPGYMAGESERRLGKALAGVPRDNYILSTKVGTPADGPVDHSGPAVRKDVERSLKRLGVDHLDLLMIHDPRSIESFLEPGAAMDELVRMKEQGLTRTIGIGCRPHMFHRAAMDTGRIDAVLTFADYTLLDQSAANDTIPDAQRRGLGIILAAVLHFGVLGGDEPDIDRHPRAHELWAWAERHDLSVRDLALQFALAMPIDGCVLVGPADAKQVKELIASARRSIPPEVWAELDAQFGVGCRVLAGK